MDVQPRSQRTPYRSYLNAKSAGRKQDAGGQDAGSITLADLPFAVPDVEHPRRVVAMLPATNVNAKAALLAEHVESFWKWRFQLRRGHNKCGCVCLMGPITQYTTDGCEDWLSSSLDVCLRCIQYKATVWGRVCKCDAPASQQSAEVGNRA